MAANVKISGSEREWLVGKFFFPPPAPGEGSSAVCGANSFSSSLSLEREIWCLGNFSLFSHCNTISFDRAHFHIASIRYSLRESSKNAPNIYNTVSELLEIPKVESGITRARDNKPPMYKRRRYCYTAKASGELAKRDFLITASEW